MMTCSDRLAGLAGSRGPGEVLSETLVIPDTLGSRDPEHPEGIVGMNGSEIAEGAKTSPLA